MCQKLETINMRMSEEMEEGEICWNGKHKHRNLIVNYNFIVVSTPFPL